MPSNPGQAIVLQDHAVTSMTKHTYLALYELFGGVINQACINYVTLMLCSYAATLHTREPEGELTGDYVPLDLTIAHTSQCPVTRPQVILLPPEDRKLRDTTYHEETTTTAHLRTLLTIREETTTSSRCRGEHRKLSV